MSTKATKFCCVLMVCFATVAVARHHNNQKREAVGDGNTIDEVRHYRKMFRVNREPLDMVESTKRMCAPPQLAYGPHYDPGIVYYINELARKGLNTFATKKLFPVGSIIVKEKQERKTEDSVQIITVMKKVRPDHSENSWEYKMYDTINWSEIDITKRPGEPLKSRTCIDCHRRYENNDYISDKGIELLFRN